jgi:hypothetical protein
MKYQMRYWWIHAYQPRIHAMKFLPLQMDDTCPSPLVYQHFIFHCPSLWGWGNCQSSQKKLALANCSFLFFRVKMVQKSPHKKQRHRGKEGWWERDGIYWTLFTCKDLFGALFLTLKVQTIFSIKAGIAGLHTVKLLPYLSSVQTVLSLGNILILFPFKVTHLIHSPYICSFIKYLLSILCVSMLETLTSQKGYTELCCRCVRDCSSTPTSWTTPDSKWGGLAD